MRSLSLLSGEPFPIKREMAILNRWLRPERGGLFVDVGTSHGLYARDIASKLRQSGATGTVIAIDISPPMLKRAQDLIEAKGYTTIDLVRARAQALPVADRSVDGVVNGGTFNEMGQQAQALADVRRVLKPDGCFVCMSLLAGKTSAGRVVQRALRAVRTSSSHRRGDQRLVSRCWPDHHRSGAVRNRPLHPCRRGRGEALI